MQESRARYGDVVQTVRATGLRFGNMETMPFKRSRGCAEPEPDKDDEVAPEVPTSFGTTGLGWSGREKQDDLDVVDLNEKKS